MKENKKEKGKTFPFTKPNKDWKKVSLRTSSFGFLRFDLSRSCTSAPSQFFWFGFLKSNPEELVGRFDFWFGSNPSRKKISGSVWFLVGLDFIWLVHLSLSVCVCVCARARAYFGCLLSWDSVDLKVVQVVFLVEIIT